MAREGEKRKIDQINPRGGRKGRASPEQPIAPGYEAGHIGPADVRYF
jgi:hypothetical protein